MGDLTLLTNKIFRFLFKPTFNKLFVVLIILAFFPVYWPNLPILEGKWLPVTTKMKVIDHSNSEDGSLIIYVDFKKKRNCVYIGMFASAKNEKLNIEFSDDQGRTDSTRPIGTYVAGPWIFSWGSPEYKKYEIISKGDLKITLRHNCHPFWETLTEFYP